MHIPRRIKIGAHLWQVSRPAKIIDDDGVTELMGQCDGGALKIKILRNLQASHAAEVFLHELLHACFLGGGVTLSEKSEERIVNMLAASLLQVVRDNRLSFL